MCLQAPLSGGHVSRRCFQVSLVHGGRLGPRALPFALPSAQLRVLRGRGSPVSAQSRRSPFADRRGVHRRLKLEAF
jgi:hypothetical protein